MARNSHGNFYFINKEFNWVFNFSINNCRNYVTDGHNGMFFAYIETSLGLVSKQIL